MLRIKPRFKLGAPLLLLWFTILTYFPTKVDAVGSTDFCYSEDNCEPGHWEGYCHDGQFQSPIDLDIADAETKPNHPLVFWKNFERNESDFFIINNCHSVQVQMKSSGASREGFNHHDKDLLYEFSQLHFHWGLTNKNGSEHALHGQRYPLEMHMVHFNQKYESLSAAVQSGDPTALSVLAVFFKIGAHNKNLQHIVKQVKSKAMHHTTSYAKAHEVLNLMSLLPRKKSMFRYQGSLTTPTCDEIVVWVIFDTPLELSKEQAKVFHAVQCEYEREKKIHNFRPLQPLHGRLVEYFEE